MFVTLSEELIAGLIVGAVINLGRSLGMATTAEGAETSDQAVSLTGQGCEEVQGFYYARAISVDFDVLTNTVSY